MPVLNIYVAHMPFTSRVHAMQARMTLLLGPPGSGKSTLLKALAGKLNPAGLRIGGNVTYNSKTFKEFVPQRTAAYIEQVDVHMAELTCVRCN